MSVLYVALPIAIAMGAAAMWACIRCIRSGQFDDLESPSVRMLIDDPPKTVPKVEPTSNDSTAGDI